MQLDEAKEERERAEKPNLLFKIPDLSQDGPSVLDGLDQLATVLEKIQKKEEKSPHCCKNHQDEFESTERRRTSCRAARYL